MVFLRSLLVIMQYTTYQMRVGVREPREGAFEVAKIFRWSRKLRVGASMAGMR